MGRVTTVVILAMLMTFWVIFLKNRPYRVYIMSKDFDYHITSILEVCIDHYEEYHHHHHYHILIIMQQSIQKL